MDEPAHIADVHSEVRIIVGDFNATPLSEVASVG